MCKTDQMKHLLTAIACCLAVAGSAQLPYNPDSNGDNIIAMDDLLDFLPLFGVEFYPGSYSNDSIVVYDMQPEIDAFCGNWQDGDGLLTITIPAVDMVVFLPTTLPESCGDLNENSTSRILIEVEDSFAYDDVTLLWLTQEHHPFNYFSPPLPDGFHFKLINDGNGNWIGPH